MITALKLFRRKCWRPKDTRLDDHLLYDFGLSRMEIEYRRG